MWLFTTDGFYSAVEDKTNPYYLTVRCRALADAEALRDRFADTRFHVKVEHTPDRDYEWRLTKVPRSVWATYLHNATESIDYTNFKTAVHERQGHERADVYLDVWTTLFDWQHGF